MGLWRIWVVVRVCGGLSPYVHPSPSDFLIEGLRSQVVVPWEQTGHWTDGNCVWQDEENRWEEVSDGALLDAAMRQGAQNRQQPGCASLLSGPDCVQVHSAELTDVLMDHWGVVDGSLFRQRMVRLLKGLAGVPRLRTADGWVALEEEEWRAVVGSEELLRGAALSRLLASLDFGPGGLAVPRTEGYFVDECDPGGEECDHSGQFDYYESDYHAANSIPLRTRRVYLVHPLSAEGQWRRDLRPSEGRFSEEERVWLTAGAEVPEQLLAAGFVGSDLAATSPDPALTLVSRSYALYDLERNPPAPPLASFEDTLAPLPHTHTQVRQLALAAKKLKLTSVELEPAADLLNRGLLWVKSTGTLPATSHAALQDFALADRPRLDTPLRLSDLQPDRAGLFQAPQRAALLAELPPRLQNALADDHTMLQILHNLPALSNDQRKLFAALMNVEPSVFALWAGDQHRNRARPAHANASFEELLARVTAAGQNQPPHPQAHPNTSGPPKAFQPAWPARLAHVSQAGGRVLRDWLHPATVTRKLLLIQTRLIAGSASVMAKIIHFYLHFIARSFGLRNNRFYASMRPSPAEETPSASAEHLSPENTSSATLPRQEPGFEQLESEFEDLMNPIVSPVEHARYTGFSWRWDAAEIATGRSYSRDALFPEDFELGLPHSVGGDIRGTWIKSADGCFEMRSRAAEITFLPAVVLHKLWMSSAAWPSHLQLRVEGYSGPVGTDDEPSDMITELVLTIDHLPVGEADLFLHASLERGSLDARISVLALTWELREPDVRQRQGPPPIVWGVRASKLIRKRQIDKDMDPLWSVNSTLKGCLCLHKIDFHLRKPVFMLDERLLQRSALAKGRRWADLEIQQDERLAAVAATSSYLLFPDQYPTVVLAAENPRNSGRLSHSNRSVSKCRVRRGDWSLPMWAKDRLSRASPATLPLARAPHPVFSILEGAASISLPFSVSPSSPLASQNAIVESSLIGKINTALRNGLLAEPVLNGDGVILNPNFRSEATGLRIESKFVPVEAGLLSLSMFSRFSRIFSHQFHEFTSVRYTEEEGGLGGPGVVEGGELDDGNVTLVRGATANDLISGLTEKLAALEELRKPAKEVKLRELNVITVMEDEETGEILSESTRIDLDEILKSIAGVPEEEQNSSSVLVDKIVKSLVDALSTSSPLASSDEEILMGSGEDVEAELEQVSK